MAEGEEVLSWLVHALLDHSLEGLSELSIKKLNVISRRH